MKTVKPQKHGNFQRNFLRESSALVFVVFLFLNSEHLSGAVYYTRGAGGNWSSPATWSTVGCNGAGALAIPGAGDDVFICNSNAGGPVIVTIDGPFTCNNLSVGSGAADATAVVTAGNSLTIAGDLLLNAGNNGNIYTLDAGPGTINVNGTFSTWGTAGTNNIQVSTGTITFVPLVTLDNAAKYITFTGAGIINFNAGFTNTQNQTRFITVGGCTVNITGTYTQITKPITWFLTSTAVFMGAASTINNSVRVNFGHVIIYDAATVSTAGGGSLNIYSNLTLNTGAAFTTTKNIPGNLGVNQSIDNITLNSGSVFNLAGTGTYIQSQGTWLNDGGTLNGGAYTVRFEGIGNTIGGTSSTTFPNLQFGNVLNNVNYSLSQNCTCSNLIFDADNSSRTFTHSGTNILNVTGNVTMNQPAGSFTNLWNVAGGSATVGGDLIFGGTNNTTTRVCKINVSTGSLSVSGNVTWMAQGLPQEVTTEVIALSGSGSVTFANPLTMEQGSGTLQVTGAGIINFNGAFPPSYDLNQTIAGNTINAVFTTSIGSTINFANGFTNDNLAVTLADGSNAVFTGSGTITPSAPITFGNVQINGGTTVSLAGNIFVTNNWTNLGGTFFPGTNTVTFNGTSAQTITKAGVETFYNLTSNTTGPFTLGSDVAVTNTLTMTAGDYNLNTFTLTLGNSAAATLVRTAGIMYGGTFRRWFPLSAISSTATPLYGLFPIGSSSDYRPVEINSTVNPTTAGYVSASHIDAITATDITYTDNEGSVIQRIHNMKSPITISGLAGGAYNIDVSFTALSSIGVLTDMKLITYTGAVPGSVGASAATTGTVPAPIVKRTGLAAGNLQNDWVIGTINSDPVAGTPLRQPYYSRKTPGNWSDATVGNATWSLTPGGAGPSCDCIPAAGALVVISSGHTVTLDMAATPDYLIIENASFLIGTGNLTLAYDIRVDGTGAFAPTGGTWSVTRNVSFAGASVSSTSPSAVMTIGGNLTMAAGSLLTLNQNLTVSGNFSDAGTIAAGTRIITLNGTAKTISGTGIITGSGSVTAANNKSVLAGTTLTIAPTFAISAATTVTNNGTITLSGNLTGADAATSIWTNAAASVLNAAGSVLTAGVGGVLNASASPNTVEYNDAGAQTLKTPAASYYNLICSNAGVKSMSANFAVLNLLTIRDAAIITTGTFRLSGTGGLTMSGTSELRLGSSIAGIVPELQGTYNLTGGTIVFNRVGGQTIRSVGLTGPAPAAYYNISTDGSATKTLAGPITVQSNLTIAGVSRLSVPNATYAINLYGNWNVTSINADAFIEGTGTVTFRGAAAQTITTVLAGGETFYNLTANNTTPAQAIQLNSPVSVTNVLALTDGHILTTAVNLLTLDASASVSLLATPQDSSFVKGPMAHTVNSTVSVTKIFPVGKDNDYRRADVLIQQGNTTTTTYTAEMLNSSARALGYTVPASLSWVSDVRYHTITQTPTTTPITVAQVYLYFNCTQKNDMVQDPPELRVAQWDGVAGWWDKGNAGQSAFSCDGLNYRGFVPSSAGAITSFTGNKFALANSSVGANPLPVELLSFDAKPNGNIVDVTWSTASELNSDYFVVQRSKDGTASSGWEDVAQVNAAGNSSSAKNYFTSDYEPYSGVSYYRLKQVDNNGQFAFSNMVMVNFESDDMLAVYPNPTSGPFNVSVKANAGEEVLIVVRDLLGREFYSKVIIMSNEKEIFAIDPSGNIASGVYLVVATSNAHIYEKKIVIR